jgi:hypothetical protein
MIVSEMEMFPLRISFKREQDCSLSLGRKEEKRDPRCTPLRMSVAIRCACCNDKRGKPERILERPLFQRLQVLVGPGLQIEG